MFELNLPAPLSWPAREQRMLPFIQAPPKTQLDIYSSPSSTESPTFSSSDDYVETSSDGRSPSPAPSLYSFSSSVDGRLMLRHAYGRILNNQNDTYFLPADNEEHRRLDLQHEVITLALGGLFPAPNLVRRALASRSGKVPAILDVGTGSGRWAIDMAKQFPYCSVVGVDLVPPRVDEDLPPNCRFEIDDANLGFSHYRESFDVIHARSISSGIRDYPGLLEELVQALRPGGVILLGDGDMAVYDEWKEQIPYTEPGSPEFSWTHRMFFASYNAMKNRGGSVDSASMGPTWLRSIGSLTDVGWHKIFIPIGPWRCSDARDRLLSEMLREDCFRFFEGMGPLLLSEGYLPESVEMMQREAAAELRELRIRVHARWNFAWAVKK